MDPMERVVKAHRQLQWQKFQACTWQELERAVGEIDRVRSQVRPYVSPNQQRHLDRYLNRCILRLVCQHYRLLHSFEQQFVRRWPYEKGRDSSQ
jgi:hypothetical protein